MLVVMRQHASQAEVDAVVERIRSLGLTPHAIPGAQRVAIGITGNKGGLDPALFEVLPGEFEELMRQARVIAGAVGRGI
jgi:3-deoxy-7-phosphoheptulonate synthase